MSGGAHMFRIPVLLLSGLLCLPLPAVAAGSREIVLAGPSGAYGPPQIERRDKSLTIEICATTCDYFVARQVQSEDEVWDTVFLHQAFFNKGLAAKWFRMTNAAHVSAVMAAYASKCSKYPQDATRATCIVKYLAARNRIGYAFVKYDGGYRCEVAGDLLTADSPSGKTKCVRVNNAR
jgi:hypothetical protein